MQLILKKIVNKEMRNYWGERSNELAKAYCLHAQSISGDLRFDLVSRAIMEHLPAKPQRIIDIGGGYGRQAIILAKAGHQVVVLDNDATMLDFAVDEVKKESLKVQNNIDFKLGDGGDCDKMFNAEFDLVCCHSVLMYLEIPGNFITAMTNIVADGGLISILSLNAQAMAMRSGLQGNYSDAMLRLGGQSESKYTQSKAHKYDDIAVSLSANHCKIKSCYGVGIFSDHLNEQSTFCNIDELRELEWQAGKVSPYKEVARRFHLIAEKY
ncbi:MAG: S-adenosylmethionine-dependent methyltransferase [Alteromonadaceae bacterium]|jgi:S-adenosylmethionine-dependent methyltransferase